MKTSLVILAAGMGSRYGGLKQLDRFGPDGETILEYSVYDAIKSGFNKIIFVIKKSFADDFKKQIVSKIKGNVEVHCVYQELADIPQELPPDSEREKPWGTGHALYAARAVINEPFLMINADDFYGRKSFKKAHQAIADGKEYFVIGYKLCNTISENGSVSRGVCFASNQKIDTLVEMKNIVIENGKYVNKNESGNTELTAETYVSMNMIGFPKSFFPTLEEKLAEFIKENIHTPKEEFLVPTVLNEMLEEDKISLHLIESDEKWFGVTYKEDKETVKNNLTHLIENNMYPKSLFSKR